MKLTDLRERQIVSFRYTNAEGITKDRLVDIQEVTDDSLRGVDVPSVSEYDDGFRCFSLSKVKQLKKIVDEDEELIDIEYARQKDFAATGVSATDEELVDLYREIFKLVNVGV